MSVATANSEAEADDEQPLLKPSSPAPQFADYFFQAGIADDASLFLRRVLQPDEIQQPKKTADHTTRAFTSASSLALNSTPEIVDSYFNAKVTEAESVFDEKQAAEDAVDLSGSEALLQQVMATIDKFDREREEASKDIARTWNDKQYRRTNLRLASLRSLSYTDLKLAHDRTGRTNQQLGSTLTLSEDNSANVSSNSENQTANTSDSMSGVSSPTLPRPTNQRSKSLSVTQSLLEPALTRELHTELPPPHAADALDELKGKTELDDTVDAQEVEEIVAGSTQKLHSSASVASLRNHHRPTPPPNPPPHRFFPKTCSNTIPSTLQSSPDIRSSHHPISLSTRRHPIEYKYYPEVISSYPPPGGEKHPNEDEKKEGRNNAQEGLPRYLSMFCFPNDISLVHQSEDGESEADASENSKWDPRWHSFVITEDANRKFYGVCVTIWEHLSPSLQLQLDDWCKVWREDNVSDSDIEYVNHVRSQIQQEQSSIALARERIKNASVAKNKATPVKADSKQEPNSTAISSSVAISSDTNHVPSAVAGNGAMRNDAKVEIENAAKNTSTSDPPISLPPRDPVPATSESGHNTSPMDKSLPPLPIDITSAHTIANEEEQEALQSIAESEEKILLYRELLKPFHNTMFVDSRRTLVPRVIGVVSRWPWYEVLRQWIAGLVLGRGGESEGGSIESHIVNLLFEIPVPPPGKLEVSLKCPGFSRRRLYCSRPALNEVPIIRNISFYPFFRALSHMNIIKIFETALTEGKIIFVSSHLSMLGLAAEVVAYLLFPLKFQGICVPVLPSGLLEYLEAPVPYIVGVGRDWWDGDKHGYSGIEDACIVDLDTNTLTFTGNTDRLALPPKHRRKLFARLNQTAPLHNLGVPYGVPENMQKLMPYGRMAPSSVTDSQLGKSYTKTTLSRRSSLGDSVSTSGTSIPGLERRSSMRSSRLDEDSDGSPPNDPQKSFSRPDHPRGPRPFPVPPPTPLSNPSADRRNSLSMPSMGTWKKAVGALSKRGGRPENSTDTTRNQKGSLSAFFVKHSRASAMFSTSETIDSVPSRSASTKRRGSLDATVPSSQTSDMDRSNDSAGPSKGKDSDPSTDVVNPSRSEDFNGVENATETAPLRSSAIPSSAGGFSSLFPPSSGDSEFSAADVILERNSEEISGTPNMEESASMNGSDSLTHAKEPTSAVSSVDGAETSDVSGNGGDLNVGDGKCMPEVVLSEEKVDPLFSTGPLPNGTTTETLSHGDNASSLLSLPLSTSYGHGSNPLSSSGSLLSFGTVPTDISGSTNVSSIEPTRSSGSDSLLYAGDRLDASKPPGRSSSVKSRRSSMAGYFGTPYPSPDETMRRSEERKEGHVFLPLSQEDLVPEEFDPYTKDDRDQVCCGVCDQTCRLEGDIVMKCDGCGTSIHRKCISQCIQPCSPTSFDEPKVLESFLRLFSSLLNNYRTFINEDAGPDDDELFRKEAFLETVDREARPFLTHLVESQCFAQFVLERHERSSNDYEILFFDEMVKAKANRSRLKLAKEATPFLKDPAYGVASTYHAISPTGTEQPESIRSLDRSLKESHVTRFPPVLSPVSFPSPRPVQPLVTDEEARMLRIHTGAITRQARMAKDKSTKKQTKWVKLRVKPFPWKQPETHTKEGDDPTEETRTTLDHKLERAYTSLRNAQRMDTDKRVENRRDIQIALDALELEYRELRNIPKRDLIDRSNHDDIEAITKQMEDTSLRLKTSLNGTQ